MQIFLDSGSVKEVEDAYSTGVVDGVTTNPSLISKEEGDFKAIVKKIANIVRPNPVSAEVISTNAKDMVKEGYKISRIARNIVVKIPLIPEGIKAISILSKKGIKTNATLCFSANQALLAAKVGATYVSPFIGRLDDIGQDGMGLIEEIQQIYENYDFPTQILVASIRHPRHVTEAAKIGADVCTIPYSIFEKLFKHPMTDIGIKKFLSDWAKKRK